MAIDWNQITSDVQSAVMKVIGSNWQTVKTGASAQIGALVQIGQSIEAQAKTGEITKAEYDSLQLSQQRAMSGILHSYAAIGITVAEQAAAAAWNVVAQALKAAYKLPFAL